MKTRLRIKQLIKLFIHSWLMTGMLYLLVFQFITITTGINGEHFLKIEWSSNLYSNWGTFDTVGLSLSLVVYIIIHIVVEWLLEHTPLKTKILKARVHNIKDSNKINQDKQDILDGK